MSETAHILQYADDCSVFCSDKKSETALEVLQDNLYKLEEYFCLNKLNLMQIKQNSSPSPSKMINASTTWRQLLEAPP